MNIESAKQLKIGDVLIVKGTHGPDEGKRGEVVSYTVRMRSETWGTIKVKLRCLDGYWSHHGKTSENTIRSFAYQKLTRI